MTRRIDSWKLWGVAEFWAFIPGDCDIPITELQKMVDRCLLETQFQYSLWLVGYKKLDEDEYVARIWHPAEIKKVDINDIYTNIKFIVENFR